MPTVFDTEIPDDGLPSVPAAWRPTKAEPIPVVRCIVIKKDGTRCKRWSLRGATVCVTHGGTLPSVYEDAAAKVEAARIRIIGLADVAVDTIEELAIQGEAEGIRLRAAQDILDRAGVRGAVDVNVKVEQGESPAERVQARLVGLGNRLIAAETKTVATASDEDEELVVDPDSDSAE